VFSENDFGCSRQIADGPVLGAALRVASTGSLIITGTTFVRNKVGVEPAFSLPSALLGGGAIALAGTNTTIRACTFIRNRVDEGMVVQGGALYVGPSPLATTVSVLGSTFQDNEIYGKVAASGGAILSVAENCRLVIRDSTFLRNNVTVWDPPAGNFTVCSGGAIAVTAGRSLSITNTTLAQNNVVAPYGRRGSSQAMGGGLLVAGGAGMRATITASNFRANRVTAYPSNVSSTSPQVSLVAGGGLAWMSSGSLSISRTDFSRNWGGPKDNTRSWGRPPVDRVWGVFPGTFMATGGG
jgi:hypothetical protein